MNKLKYRHLFSLVLLIVLAIALTGCEAVYSLLEPAGTVTVSSAATSQSSSQSEAPAEEGRYTSPDDVAAYLNTYSKLPPNYITKREAADLGWESEKGNLWEVTDELSIGGDVFGNREGLLPKKSGRIWYECDVNYFGGYRTAERIVYSNDGLIFYTDDHYQTFVQLY